ncbi:YesL family protein [Alkalihalobacillus sp. 1P02AB]|uniref:YesL family protein n=1 Tax=Alkalihalobacillus sp. 1P02AB TaxID=3132260 RepID=UPI0039A767F1
MSQALYRLLEWITRFAYINLLWIAFTLVGAVIFGLFPATIAMFTLIRKWIIGDHDKPIFPSFWKVYKAEFIKSNLLAIWIYIAFVIIGYNLFFLYLNIGQQLTWATAPLFAGMILFVLFLFYLFPAYVHFELKTLPLIKNTFLMMLVSPLQSLAMLISIGSTSLIVYVFPATAFIFGASFYGFITLWFAIQAFNKIQDKQQLGQS